MACMSDAKAFNTPIEVKVQYSNNSGEPVSDPALHDTPIDVNVQYSKNSGEPVSDLSLHKTFVGCLIYFFTTQLAISYFV